MYVVDILKMNSFLISITLHLISIFPQSTKTFSRCTEFSLWKDSHSFIEEMMIHHFVSVVEDVHMLNI